MRELSESWLAHFFPCAANLRHRLVNTKSPAAACAAANRLKALRWQDRATGHWMEYRLAHAASLQFQLMSYGDRNTVAASLG